MSMLTFPVPTHYIIQNNYNTYTKIKIVSLVEVLRFKGVPVNSQMQKGVISCPSSVAQCHKTIESENYLVGMGPKSHLIRFLCQYRKSTV